MPWTNVGPKLYRRPIGENERFIKGIGDRAHATGREHWSVSASGRFSMNRDMSQDALQTCYRLAWRLLRFQHPSIASTAGNDNLEYQIPDEREINAWEGETLRFHVEKASVVDIIAALQPNRYVTMDILLQSNEVVLHFAHWRTDGFGALQLVDALFHQLCKAFDDREHTIAWGEEVTRLVPSVEEVLKLPMEPTPEIAEETNRCLATLALTRNTVGIASTADPTTPPSSTRSFRCTLSENTTQGIEESCTNLGLTVLAAVHASCAAATYANSGSEQAGKPYTSTIRLTLRPYLPFPYNTAHYAAAISTGGYMAQVSASSSWLERARSYQHMYGVGVTPGFLQARRQYAIEVQQILSKGAPPPPYPPSEIDISSVGDADKLVSSEMYGGAGLVLRIEDIGVGVETLTRQTYCFVWTFQGRLSLSLVYNEAYYDASYAKQLTFSIRDSLLSELRVAMPDQH